MPEPKVNIPTEVLSDLCMRWKIASFAIFGSALREDFRPDSDVDVLIGFVPDAGWSLFDLVRLLDELEAIFGRKVDLLTRPGVERSRNVRRRNEILSTARVLYAA